jgi:outer membrane immunogenic protein
MRKSVLAAAAAIAVAGAAMSGQASAADMGFESSYPAYQQMWQGFHIGGHLGYGEAEVEGRADVDYIDDVEPELDESFTLRKSFTPDGIIGGAQAGYDWQWDSLVFGLEGDISFANWSDNSVLFDEPLDDFGFAADAIGRASADVDMLATIRGRLGMAFDNVLVYGTGGVAWADAEARASIVLDDGLGVDTLWSAKKSFSDIGFVAGGGIAWMVIPQSFSVGLEGLYYFFDQQKTLADATFDVGPGDLEVIATATLDDVWVVRTRADFHF